MGLDLDYRDYITIELIKQAVLFCGLNNGWSEAKLLIIDRVSQNELNSIKP